MGDRAAIVEREQAGAARAGYGQALLQRLANVVCAPRRVEELRKLVKGRGLALDDLGAAWRALVTADHDVGRAYVMHLIDRVELYDDRAGRCQLGRRGPTESKR